MKSLIIFNIIVAANNYQFLEGFLQFKQKLNPLTDANVYFYYGPKNQKQYSVQLKNIVKILKHPEFNLYKATTFYIHGFSENQTKTSTPTVRKAYSYRKDHNFLILDYNAFANGSYFAAVFNVLHLAPFVSRALMELFNAGLPIEKLHLVGHSLGGQLAGHIGRNLITQTKGLKILNRISALDPAFPLFYIISLVDPLRSSDAKLVDVIHTDAKIYGAPFPTGTIDFWPNGGTSLQPGCPPRTLATNNANDYCSHWRSFRFWAETVSTNYDRVFLAYKANSFDEYKTKSSKSYSDNEIAIMGLDISMRTGGNYYLVTNFKNPFARTLSAKKNKCKKLKCL